MDDGRGRKMTGMIGGCGRGIVDDEKSWWVMREVGG